MELSKPSKCFMEEVTCLMASLLNLLHGVIVRGKPFSPIQLVALSGMISTGKVQPQAHQLKQFVDSKIVSHVVEAQPQSKNTYQ